MPAWLDEVASEMLSMTRVLGIRTAELHLALAQAEADDLAPVHGQPGDTQQLASQVKAEAETTRQLLETSDALADVSLPDLESEGWKKALRRLDRLAETPITSPKIRLHGDYHLGQVLQADGEFYILDFEGEPARPLEERRKRGHALRDVAGMLRSLDYSILAAWQEHANGHSELADWADALTRWCEALFLQAYLDTTDTSPFVVSPEHREQLLWTYLFEKVLYEVRYEVNHRPGWVWLPLRGLQRLLDDAQLDIEPLVLDAPSSTESTEASPAP
jgi:maltose alpha-D-glucosyltransferase/alpha-amylase